MIKEKTKTTTKVKKTAKRVSKTSKAKLVERKRPAPRGWNTSDEDEIERRRQRGIAENIRIENLEADVSHFSTFLAHSESGASYRVEIRSLSEPINSCECPDYLANGLGTCKHIEKILYKLHTKAKRRFAAAAKQGSPHIEVYVDRRNNNAIHIHRPKGLSTTQTAWQILDPLFSAAGTLLADPSKAIPALKRIVSQAHGRTRSKIRLSSQLDLVAAQLIVQHNKEQIRKTFLADVDKGKRSLDVVKHPLYPYQEHGMLHLAFNERALLADEMGLGKTVQAIAACELLRQIHGISKVLVIATASLKTEWEEQIGKFTDLPCQIIQGTRPARIKQYQTAPFFNLANYEQVVNDIDVIQEILAPDVIILDEAQRIKNWRTKTANAMKQLRSRFAFVLTGTPVENRIDDIYSIVQFLDPNIFGFDAMFAD